MPVCTKCKYEYVEGVKVCTGCGLELVDELPEEEEYICENCENHVDADDSYCKNCGILLDDSISIKCEKHPNVEADSLCLICKKPLCNNCAVEVTGKFFCFSHSNYHFIEGNWVAIYTTNQDFDAQMHKDYLTEKSIPCLIHSKMDSARMFGAHLLLDFRIMVPFDHVLEAEKYIEELDNQE